MIRDAVEQDLDELLELAEEFWKHTIYDEELEHDRVLQMFQVSFDHNLFLVLELEGKVRGFMTAIKAPLLASTKATMAVETAFYIDPDYRGNKIGVDLILQMEQKVKQQGIKYWNMVSMESSSPEVANKLYLKLGYTKSETSFTKVIN